MLSDQIRARLSALNRAELTSESERTTGSDARDSAVPTPADLEVAARTDFGVTVLPEPIDEACPDDVSQLPPGVELENKLGRCWLRQRPVAKIWPAGAHWLTSRLARLESLGDRQPDSVELAALLHSLPERAVFLDLETCGFAGSMIFLIGVIHHDQGRLVLSQLLARNYAEERVVLEALWSWVAGKRLLVTFNGKSFDWPMVVDRTILHRLDVASLQGPATRAGLSPESDDDISAAGHRPSQWPFPTEHCDLLHLGRRRWKRVLPDCKLQTLERYICRRHRSGDIAGREIPAAYHDFVRTGDAWLMRSVLHHNALDLITLLQLSILLATRTKDESR